MFGFAGTWVESTLRSQLVWSWRSRATVCRTRGIIFSRVLLFTGIYAYPLPKGHSRLNHVFINIGFTSSYLIIILIAGHIANKIGLFVSVMLHKLKGDGMYISSDFFIGSFKN